MALWADKHRPKSLEDLAYNVDQLRMLKQMTSTNDFPHLLFVGPDGCGKRTRMHCLLREIYGDGIYQMKHTTLPMETAAGKPIKITGVDSKYHIEVRPRFVLFLSCLFLASIDECRRVSAISAFTIALLYSRL